MGISWYERVQKFKSPLHVTDKTFLIAEPIRKVSWTGRSAAGVGSVKPGLVCRAAQFGLNC